MNSREQFLKLNPYVRIVQHIFGNSENYFVPYRIIYDYEMMFVVDGELTILLDDETVTVQKNECVIIPPFLRHKQNIKRHCEYYGLHLDFFYDENNQDFSGEIYIRPCEQRKKEITIDPQLSKRNAYSFDQIGVMQRIPVSQPSNICALFQTIYAAYQRIEQDILSQLEIKANTLILIQLLLKESIQHTEAIYSDTIIFNFLNYVSTHFREDINITELTKEYGFTPNYFRKLFKDKINKSPKEFIIDMRLDEAKKLLKLGQYTISEICSMVGYDDLHYFSRLFKQKEGISPAAFAKKFEEP